MVPALGRPALESRPGGLDKSVDRVRLPDPQARGFDGRLIGFWRPLELREQVDVDPSARGQNPERTDVLALERTVYGASLREGEVADLGDHVVLALDPAREAVDRHRLVGEQVERLGGVEPRNVEPKVGHADFPHHRPQAGGVIPVGMGQHHVLQDRVRPEMPAEVRDDLDARLGVAAVDEHQPVVVGLAVADHDGVAGLGGGADGQELDLAVEEAHHAPLPSPTGGCGAGTTSITNLLYPPGVWISMSSGVV